MIMTYLFKKTTNKPQEETGRISIVTTTFPLYDFAKNIGGADVDVKLLLPPGTEPHAFEPTPTDIVAIHDANLFIYTGEFMEPWAEDVIDGIDTHVRSIDTSNGITLLHTDDDHEEDDAHIDDHHADEVESHTDHDHAEGIDPHIWLDFDNTQKMVDTIAHAIVQEDPSHADTYLSNATAYKQQLAQLDDLYTNTLATCQQRKIISSGHYSFGYLSNKYDLNYESVYGLSPNAEPSAQDIAKLIDQITHDNISAIFYEELIDPKVARTLSDETNTQLFVLNPAGNISKTDYQNNKTFIELMKENLQNLVQGLSCKQI